MKLTKIEIIHFGKISEKNYDLKPDLDVFFGENEAGKSTTVAFIKQIMFGFHLKNNKSAFFEDYFPLSKASPMGGRLHFQDGEHEFILQRTYASGDSKKGSLKVYLDGQEVPENVFFDKIKNIDGDFYTDSFIFNQDMLTQVNSLNQNELMERIYFLGAAQSNKLLALRKDYASHAADLFKKTGRKPIINQLINELTDKKSEVSDISNEFESYQALLLQIKKLESEQKQKQAQLVDINKENQKLLLMKQKIKNFDEYQELQKQQKNIAFSPELYDQAQSLSLEIKNLQASLDSKMQYVDQLQKQLLLQEQVKKMQALVDQKAEFLQWQNEVSQLKRNIQQLNDEIAQIQTINPDISKIENITPEQVSNLRNELQTLKSQNTNNTQKAAIPNWAGWIIAIVGLILAFAMHNFVWLVLMLIGIGLSIWTNRESKDKGAEVDQKVAFEQKYSLNSDTFDLDSTLNLLYQIQAKQKSVLQNEADLENLNSQIKEFEVQLAHLLQVNVSNQETVISSLRDLTQELTNQTQIKSKFEQLNQEIDHLKTQLKLQKQNLLLTFSKANVQDPAEFDELRKQANIQAKLKLQLDTIRNNLGDDLDKIKNLESENNSIDQKLADLQKQAVSYQNEISDLQAKLAEIRVKQDNLADSNELFNKKQELATLQSQLQDEMLEYLSDLAVSNWIGRSLDLASNERFPKMLVSAKEYFKLLTGGRYVDLKLDKKLVVVDDQGKKKEVQYLSRGTSEQLYFALKLAFVEQIADEISLPILIDDAFVNFDNQRTEYIVKLIDKLSAKMQVLIFTNRKELASDLNSSVINLSSEVR